MEMPDVGAHCEVTSCKALDFLPTTCPYCKLVFCQVHANIEAHQCSCSNGKKTIGNIEPEAKCGYHGCITSVLKGSVCPHCGMSTCASHRFPEKHGCKITFQQQEEFTKLKKNKESAMKRIAQAKVLAASTTTRKLRSASKISKQVILMKARGLAKPLREMIPSAKRHLLILAAVQIVKEPDATSVECMHVFPCFAHVNGSLADAHDHLQLQLGGTIQLYFIYDDVKNHQEQAHDQKMKSIVQDVVSVNKECCNDSDLDSNSTPEDDFLQPLAVTTKARQFPDGSIIVAIVSHMPASSTLVGAIRDSVLSSLFALRSR